jgi:hypothetical protein
MEIFSINKNNCFIMSEYYCYGIPELSSNPTMEQCQAFIEDVLRLDPALLDRGILSDVNRARVIVQVYEKEYHGPVI